MAKMRKAENRVVVTEDSVSFEESVMNWENVLLAVSICLAMLVASWLSSSILVAGFSIIFLARVLIAYFRPKKQVVVCREDGIESTVFLRGVVQGRLRYPKADLGRVRYTVFSEGDKIYKVLGFDYQGKEVKLSPHLSASELDTILRALERFGYDVEWDVAWKMILDIEQRGWF